MEMVDEGGNTDKDAFQIPKKDNKVVIPTKNENDDLLSDADKSVRRKGKKKKRRRLETMTTEEEDKTMEMMEE